MDRDIIRVGDPGSPIRPGDPSPGGGIYRRGQFSPTAGELSSLSLIEANEAGLLSEDLPIFDVSGKITERSVENWTPRIDGVHINSRVPKYSAAVIVDVLGGRGNLLKTLGMSYIDAGTREDQEALQKSTPHLLTGEVIIRAEASTVNGFYGRLVTYPSFYKYVSIPLLKPKGSERGLSVAAYVVFHSLGHLMFARLVHDGKLKVISTIIEGGGWSKHQEHDNTSASFLGYTNKSSIWKRKIAKRNLTEACKFSPMDEFAETFAIYFTNYRYLEAIFPERLDVMIEVLEEYGHVL